MAVRRPLVTIAGVVQELPLPDTLPGSGGVTDGNKVDVTVSAIGETWTVNPKIKYGLPLVLGTRQFNF